MKRSLLFLLLSVLLHTGLLAQAAGTAPKITKEANLALQKAKTKPKDKKMGLPGPRRTETIEKAPVATAIQTLEKGQVQAAIAQLDDYADTDADAAYGLGLAYYENGEMEKAVGMLEHAVQLEATHSDALFALGQIYLETGNYDQAEAIFLTMIEQDERDADAWYELGFIYSLSPDFYAVAEDCLTRALAIAPQHPDAPYELSRLHALQGDEVGALEYLEQAFKNGFRDEAFVREDADLESLRATGGFEDLMTAYFPD